MDRPDVETFEDLEDYFHASIAHYEKHYPEAMAWIYKAAGPLPPLTPADTAEMVESTLNSVRRICLKLGK